MALALSWALYQKYYGGGNFEKKEFFDRSKGILGALGNQGRGAGAILMGGRGF